jgi:hypothetical protein
MFKLLNKQELEEFINKYFNIYDEYTKTIKKVSSISYRGITEYLINDQYIIRMYK